MTSGERLRAYPYSDLDRAAGFGVGRDLGRQRIGNEWVDRQPPEHFMGARWDNWMSGYRQGLRERAIGSGQTPYRAGQAAFLDGFWRSENPHPLGSGEYEAWLCGWLDTRRLKTRLRGLQKAIA